MRYCASPKPAAASIATKAAPDRNTTATTPHMQKAAARNHSGNTNRSAPAIPSANGTSKRSIGSGFIGDGSADNDFIDSGFIGDGSALRNPIPTRRPTDQTVSFQ